MEELTFKVCDHCHGKMLPQTMSRTFKFDGKEIEIKGIHGYRCENCGNEVYEAKEIRMIDKIIRAMSDKPAVDKVLAARLKMKLLEQKGDSVL